MGTQNRGFRINRRSDVGYILLTAFEEHEEIKHGFSIKGSSEKWDGGRADFSLPHTRRRFMEALGFQQREPAMVRQVHGDRILVIKEDTDRSLFNKNVRADAMVTNIARLPLAILTADCLPVLLFNREAGAVGIVHAGRRGTLHGVARRAVRAMEEAFGAPPEATWVAFGPAIGPCCYEVGREVAEPFKGRYNWWERVLRPGREGKFQLDLFEANSLQLQQAGILPQKIIAPRLCTSCHDSLFYSYRRDGGIKGVILSFIMLDG